MAKEFFNEEKTPIKNHEGKTVMAALKRNIDWEDANLITKEHLEPGQFVEIHGCKWLVMGASGLGIFLKAKQKGWRVYVVLPELIFQPQDEVIHIKTRKRFTIDRYDCDRQMYITSNDQGLSVFYPEEFRKITNRELPPSID